MAVMAPTTARLGVDYESRHHEPEPQVLAFPMALGSIRLAQYDRGRSHMRKITAAVLTLCVAGCATAAQREVDRMKTSADRGIAAARSCDTQVAATPEYQSIKAYMPTDDGPSLATQTNSSKATPEEIRAIFAVHAAMAPCRKIRVEAANDVSPLLVPPLVGKYARNDAIYVGLVDKKLTWGEFSRALEAVHIEGKKQFDAAIAQIEQGLNQSHSAEIARRQQAAAALSNWAYQQQVLLQNQQMINAMNQPRMTNCQYVGAYLQCTTF
jgi:hypothetical protein